MGRQWFKHYANASDGASLRILWDGGDLEAYGMFWRFLELMAKFETGDTPGQMTLSWNVIGRETGWKPSKCRRVLSRICSVSKIEMEEKPEGNVTFLLPKWVELQGSWGGKRGARFEQDAGRSKKIEKRNKKVDIEIEGTPPSAKPTLPLLIEIWNRESGTLPKATGSSPKRTAAAKARFTERPDEGYWVTVVQKIAASDFCRGVSETGWIAGVDFLLKPDTHLKVMEGKYDNRTGPVKPPESDSMRASREYIERLERESREILG